MNEFRKEYHSIVRECVETEDSYERYIKSLETQLSETRAEIERLLRLNGHIANENLKLRDKIERLEKVRMKAIAYREHHRFYADPLDKPFTAVRELDEALAQAKEPL